MNTLNVSDGECSTQTSVELFLQLRAKGEAELPSGQKDNITVLVCILIYLLQKSSTLHRRLRQQKEYEIFYGEVLIEKKENFKILKKQKSNFFMSVETCR